MKMLKITTLMMLAIIAVSETISAEQTITFTNGTEVAIWVHCKAKHKTKQKQTRHDETTVKLAPAPPRDKKTGQYTTAFSESSRGSFSWSGDFQFMQISNYNSSKPAPRTGAISTTTNNPVSGKIVIFGDRYTIL